MPCNNPNCPTCRGAQKNMFPNINFNYPNSKKMAVLEGDDFIEVGTNEKIGKGKDAWNELLDRSEKFENALKEVAPNHPLFVAERTPQEQIQDLTNIVKQQSEQIASLLAISQNNKKGETI